MTRLDVAKSCRMQVRASNEERVNPLLAENNLGLQTLSKARNTAVRLGSVKKAHGTMVNESLVQPTTEIPRRGMSGGNEKLEEVLSSLHHVSQANALLRKKLERKDQPAELTKENLMMHEETYETNRPAIQLQRKQEFIRKEMEKGRRSAAPSDEKLALLRRIDEREEKAKASERKVRSDSVLGELRKAKFRHLALMAQKRLQSVSPDVLKMEEEKEGLASQIGWYLNKFCGEGEGDEDEFALREESCSGTGTGARTPN